MQLTPFLQRVALAALLPATTNSHAVDLTRVDAARPLSFEFNIGQADAAVDFVARGKGGTVGLGRSEAWLRLERDRGLRLRFAGANERPAAEGLDLQAGTANYFRGNDPNGWKLGAPTFSKVKYHDIYPGVDLVYYGNQQELEYDLIVQPGADLGAIAMDFEGAKKISVDAGGNLLFEVGAKMVRQHKPVVYQETGAGRKMLSGNYVLRSETEAGIQVADYDKTKPLVIDPLLNYSETFGGSALNQGMGIAVDAQGNVYVTGNTFAADFQIGNAFQSNLLGSQSAFVTKFDTNGTLIYSTYLGGGVTNDFTTTGSSGLGIAVDTNGDAFVTGYTTATNFPVMNAIQSTKAAKSYNGRNAFITKLNAAGDGLMYSTYLGGTNSDAATGIAVDLGGEAVITGFTSSSNFPTAHAAQPVYGGSGDGFVAKLSAEGSELVYATYLGGTSYENEDLSLAGSGQPVGAVAVDETGAAYVTGLTYSTNFPIMTAFQTTNQTTYYGADSAAFVTKFDAVGNVVYSTYFGGDLGDVGRAIGVDSHHNVYFGGNSSFGYLPITNAMQPNFGGDGVSYVGDGFVAALDATGTNLIYCTYVGGSGDDQVNGIAVRSDGEVAVTGFTDSPNFPGRNAVQPIGFQGLFKSPDGASTWNLSNSGLSSGIVYAIEVDPFDSAIVYALTKNGFFLSTNGGANWDLANTGLGFASPAFSGASGSLLALDPIHPGTLYVGGFSGVYKTTNGAANWFLVSAGLPVFPSYAEVQALAIDPNMPATLYTGTYANGVFKSVDAGNSWVAVTNGLSVLDIQALVVDPQNSSRVYAGGENFGFGSTLFESTNGGGNWTLVNGAPGGAVNLLAVSSSGVYVVAGNDFSSPNLGVTTNGGASWNELLFGGGVKFTALAFAPAQVPDLEIASLGSSISISWPNSFTGYVLQSTPSLEPGTWQNVTEKEATNETSWVVNVPISGSQDYYRLRLTNGATASPPILYMGTDQGSGQGTLQSTDGGSTWTVAGPFGDTINALAVDPRNPNTVYAGLDGGRDGFVCTLTPTGQLDSSSYLGGSGGDEGNGVAINVTDVYVAGTTSSDDFPTLGPTPSGIQKNKATPRGGRGGRGGRDHPPPYVKESDATTPNGNCTVTDVKGAAAAPKD
jgi:hypothetical protein